MGSPAEFVIRAVWQGRREFEGTISARLRAFLTLSQAPPGRSWHCVVGPDDYRDLQAEPGYVDAYVAECMRVALEGEWARLPGNGCAGVLGPLCADDVPRADDPYLEWLIGGSNGINSVYLFTDNEGKTDPRFVSYEVMRSNVLAMAGAFAPDWCQAGPIELQRYLDTAPYNRPAITLAWMVWLSPAYAKLVEPPHPSCHVIVEPMTDGSLFMATGTETFDVNGYLHLDKARAIHRQLDALNYTVPFNGTCGRNDRVPPFPKV